MGGFDYAHLPPLGDASILCKMRGPFTILNWVSFISKAPGSNPLGAQLGLGTQPRYEAPGDVWVEYV